MKIYATSQNFTGYKNIIANNIYGTKGRIAFITAQLDDKLSPDLSYYKQIKKLFKLPSESIDNDVVNIIYAHKYGAKPELFLDNKILYWGNELKQLETMIPKIMPEEEYQEIKVAHMKTYTLISSLAKRMTNDKFSYQDENFKNCIKQFMKVFTVFTKDNDTSFDFLDLSLRQQKPFQKIATFFNEIVIKTMSDFF